MEFLSTAVFIPTISLPRNNLRLPCQPVISNWTYLKIINEIIITNKIRICNTNHSSGQHYTQNTDMTKSKALRLFLDHDTKSWLGLMNLWARKNLQIQFKRSDECLLTINIHSGWKEKNRCNINHSLIWSNEIDCQCDKSDVKICYQHVGTKFVLKTVKGIHCI